MHIYIYRHVRSSSSVVASLPSEAVAILLGVATGARRHEVAEGPHDLHLDVAPLRRRPLLLGQVAAAADAAVLVAVLHRSLPSSRLPCR
ncbi:hypothetical protein C2845_PM05G35300 [Panicum miliaceum]|uniref:Uncharacterized protein n=1 Tax=Panicum miliaceum TaxID=4540 RepID=A0A3L6T2H6_PANMI|nr:hypothetical protein C2845_PM05G35300 [Panicum miliaceum]